MTVRPARDLHPLMNQKARGVAFNSHLRQWHHLQLLKLLLSISRDITEKIQHANERLHSMVARSINHSNSLSGIYFTKGGDLADVNLAALYVMKNEQTKWHGFVHEFDQEEEIPPDLAQHLKMTDRMYPSLKIDFDAVKGEFRPELIEKRSKRPGVPMNYMFISTTGDRFPHEIETLGGVCLIL